MRIIAIGMLLAASFCFAQDSSDFKPATSNVLDAQYPQVDSNSRVQIRFKAPDATKVKLNFWSGPKVDMEKQALYGLFAFLLLLPAVFGPQDRGLVRRFLQSWPLVSLGVISYGIYLWHLDLIHQLQVWTGWTAGAEPFWLLAGATLAASIAFASASYFWVERPILRRKNRIGWWSRNPPPPAPASPVGAGDAEATTGTVT